MTFPDGTVKEGQFENNIFVGAAAGTATVNEKVVES